MTELSPQYGEALAQLQGSAPDCLRQAEYPQFFLPDGSVRQSLARDSQDQPSLVPACLEAEYDVITRHLDEGGPGLGLEIIKIKGVTGQPGKQRKFKVRPSRLIVC